LKFYEFDQYDLDVVEVLRPRIFLWHGLHALLLNSQPISEANQKMINDFVDNAYTNLLDQATFFNLSPFEQLSILLDDLSAFQPNFPLPKNLINKIEQLVLEVSLDTKQEIIESQFNNYLKNLNLDRVDQILKKTKKDEKPPSLSNFSGSFFAASDSKSPIIETSPQKSAEATSSASTSKDSKDDKKGPAL